MTLRNRKKYASNSNLTYHLSFSVGYSQQPSTLVSTRHKMKSFHVLDKFKTIFSFRLIEKWHPQEHPLPTLGERKVNVYFLKSIITFLYISLLASFVKSEGCKRTGRHFVKFVEQSTRFFFIRKLGFDLLIKTFLSKP